MMKGIRTQAGILFFSLFLMILASSNRVVQAKESACKGPKEDPDIVWCGSSPQLTFEKLAAYLGPILAFSPDEPLLKGTSGASIIIPEAMPFEEPSKGPVVYYRLRNVI